MATIAPRQGGRGRIKSLDEILATAEKKSLKRSLGAFQLTLLGIGAVIGTGIFVLTATAAQKAGPGMMVSFIVAGIVCALAALCYSELASMVPVAGSAYTYSYAVMGEMVAWLVGWALILEYALGASAVAVGWSGFISGLLDSVGVHIPHALKVGPPIQWGFLQGGEVGGLINLPAVLVVVLRHRPAGHRHQGKRDVQRRAGGGQGHRPDAVPHHHPADDQRPCRQLPAVRAARLGQSAELVGHRHPRRRGVDLLRLCRLRRGLDRGRGNQEPAAQRADRPDRQPADLHGLLPARRGRRGRRLRRAAADATRQPAWRSRKARPSSTPPRRARRRTRRLVCSKEALAHILREVSNPLFGNLVGLAAAIALPSVVLLMMFGQTRIFFVMARDGLLPERLSTVHPRFRTPYIVTIVTGVFVAIAAAFLPVGTLADYSNSGTLFAFAVVSLGGDGPAQKDPGRTRPFRTPALFVVAPLAIVGCLLLFVNLNMESKLLFVSWTVIGLVIYFLYGYATAMSAAASPRCRNSRPTRRARSVSRRCPAPRSAAGATAARRASRRQAP